MRVGLALSGGAARGLAHVGVLSVFLDEGIPIDVVAGTSAGALVGALYCAGLELEHVQRMAGQINWSTVARPAWSRQGLVSFSKMASWLHFFIGDVRFCDLPLPFAAVCTDLETGRPVMLSQGRVAPAVQASCAIPGLITPVEIDGRLLYDGGVSANLPAFAARALGADYVIGVDLMEPYLDWRRGPLGAAVAGLESLIHHSGGGLEQVDCRVVPRLAGKSLVRFKERQELLALGQAAARECLPQLRQEVG